MCRVFLLCVARKEFHCRNMSPRLIRCLEFVQCKRIRSSCQASVNVFSLERILLSMKVRDELRRWHRQQVDSEFLQYKYYCQRLPPTRRVATFRGIHGLPGELDRMECTNLLLLEQQGANGKWEWVGFEDAWFISQKSTVSLHAFKSSENLTIRKTLNCMKWKVNPSNLMPIVVWYGSQPQMFGAMSFLLTKLCFKELEKLEVTSKRPICTLGDIL